MVSATYCALIFVGICLILVCEIVSCRQVLLTACRLFKGACRAAAAKRRWLGCSGRQILVPCGAAAKSLPPDRLRSCSSAAASAAGLRTSSSAAATTRSDPESDRRTPAPSTANGLSGGRRERSCCKFSTVQSNILSYWNPSCKRVP
jgi:hypothetical protein